MIHINMPRSLTIAIASGISKVYNERLFRLIAEIYTYNLVMSDISGLARFEER